MKKPSINDKQKGTHTDGGKTDRQTYRQIDRKEAERRQRGTRQIHVKQTGNMRARSLFAKEHKTKSKRLGNFNIILKM
jgi:hypothetical protein